MTSQVLGSRIATLAYAALMALALAPLMVVSVSAQTAGEKFSAVQPEFAGLFNAVYLAQARMLAEIAAIDNSAATRDARNQFERSLRMRANLSMAEMMATMGAHPNMQMPGPFDELESALSDEMMELLQARHSRTEILDAYEDSSLPNRAVEVISLGRQFESRIFELLVDNSISDKEAALADAVSTYLSSGLSVPIQPKLSSLLLAHPYAGAFAAAYPKVSGLLWTTQWLQLATIEAMILQEQDSYYWGSIDTVRERFQNKLVDSTGTRSPVPVELPMAPAIAPTLFTLNPQAAIVLDNLSMFETVLSDILSYPNLGNKEAVVNSLVDEFTDHAEDFDPTIDYLVSALRGGIYNQGGPAVGELSQSERNRSRMEMGMQHAMTMSSP